MKKNDGTGIKAGNFFACGMESFSNFYIKKYSSRWIAVQKKTAVLISNTAAYFVYTGLTYTVSSIFSL
jgi:hypothetical protein